MKVNRVARATENVFIAGCCEYVYYLPDTIDQASDTTVALIFIEFIGNMVKQIKRLQPSPLEEGVRA
jgi:hypothetical protein